MAKITLAHGGGGTLMHQLIREVALRQLGNPVLNRLMDSALLELRGRKLAFTTDSYVVKPLFFPGSDIGKLAVYGTVNDLSVCGARPLYISLSFIIEEGLDRAVLQRVVRSIKEATRRAGVTVVTGDTKVVEKGKCDRLYINTSGIGLMSRQPALSIDRIRVGDMIITSGSLGDHGISVLAAREGINLRGSVRSDAAPLNKLIAKIITTGGVRFMRDPTRGGLAMTLNEIVDGRRLGIVIREEHIVMRPPVYAAVELLGLDPLYIANEGKVVIVASKKHAHRILSIMRRDTHGRQARVIGEVTKDYQGKVVLATKVGGRRVVDMPGGELLPRIC
jgi:hydrogenase expression/formation protein HypE